MENKPWDFDVREFPLCDPNKNNFTFTGVVEIPIVTKYL